MKLRNFLMPGLVAMVTLVGCGGSGKDGAFNGAPTGTDTGAGTGTGGTGTDTTTTTTTAPAGTTDAETSTDGSMEQGSGGSATVAATTDGSASSSTDSGSGGGSATMTDCTITASAELSEAIQTVGIVTFSTDLPQVDDAQIEFGLDENYGMTAPVDLNETDYRTLLLGMKQDHEYHYRIVVSSGTEVCESEDYTLTTGLLMNGLPVIDVVNEQPDKLAGGFMLTGQYEAMGGPLSPAYIIDSDGDYVWALAVGNFVTGVRMSYDGKHMWINGTDNTAGGQSHVHRVTMDGLVDEDLSADFVQQDHSLGILPDETVIFYGHDMASQCSIARERHPDGTIKDIVNIRDVSGVTGTCHVNYVAYSRDDDTLIFSDVYHNNYTKITRDGQLVWVLGGETSQFTGDGSQWNREHGLFVLGEDRLLYFNNGSDGSNGIPREPSVARELQLDLDAMTATDVWDYASETPIYNIQLGDVQRLDNGNTTVAYSTQGIVHEVDPDGNLVQEMTWPLGGAFGYIIRRMSLYGPPPR